jgi:hypothetical protein
MNIYYTCIRLLGTCRLKPVGNALCRDNQSGIIVHAPALALGNSGGKNDQTDGQGYQEDFHHSYTGLGPAYEHSSHTDSRERRPHILSVETRIMEFLRTRIRSLCAGVPNGGSIGRFLQIAVHEPPRNALDSPEDGPVGFCNGLFLVIVIGIQVSDPFWGHRR